MLLNPYKKRLNSDISFIGYFIMIIILGILSGVFYFGGLWLTLQYMARSRYPALVTLFSYIFRIAVSFFILLYIARFGEWTYILYWLAGFILARSVLSRLLGDNYPKKEKKEQ